MKLLLPILLLHFAGTAFSQWGPGLYEKFRTNEEKARREDSIRKASRVTTGIDTTSTPEREQFDRIFGGPTVTDALDKLLEKKLTRRERKIIGTWLPDSVRTEKKNGKSLRCFCIEVRPGRQLLWDCSDKDFHGMYWEIDRARNKLITWTRAGSNGMYRSVGFRIEKLTRRRLVLSTDAGTGKSPFAVFRRRKN